MVKSLLELPTDRLQLAIIQAELCLDVMDADSDEFTKCKRLITDMKGELESRQLMGQSLGCPYANDADIFCDNGLMYVGDKLVETKAVYPDIDNYTDFDEDEGARVDDD